MQGSYIQVKYKLFKKPGNSFGEQAFNSQPHAHAKHHNIIITVM